MKIILTISASIYLLESIDAWIPIQIIYIHGHFEDYTIWVWAACVDTRNWSFSKLEKKNMKGLYTIQDFLHIFLSFNIICNKHNYGIICNKCQGTFCEAPYIQLKLINRFWVIRLFKIFDVSLSFFPGKQYNALTVKSSVFSFFSIGLVSFKFIEPIVGDLQDPATIYHTVWWLKVAMRFYICTMKITHSLKKDKNKRKITSNYFKNSHFCSHKYIPKTHLVTLTMSVTSDVTNMLSSFTSSFSRIS